MGSVYQAPTSTAKPIYYGNAKRDIVGKLHQITSKEVSGVLYVLVILGYGLRSLRK
jgi:hypothetical protein